jgi:hypothetical protein
MAKEVEKRTRTWTIVVYPDSAPENWRDILDEMHFPWIESPLHDKDINATGEVKKAHLHILLMFDGVKSYDQVKDIATAINAPIPERCHNARAMVRYMAHLDNPDKAQYLQTDIKAHGGADVAEMLRPSMSERYTFISDMMEFVENNGITEFSELLDYSRKHQFDRWFPILCDSSSFVMAQYIKSKRHGSPLKKLVP